MSTKSFWERVGVRSASECWEWTGAKQSAGYGVLRRENAYHLAHRYAYELAVGAIPVDMTIDHLCRNRACCNPGHMEVVTRSENSRRGERNRTTCSGGRPDLAARTHCKHGHEFTPENTRSYGTGRICRTCVARRAREHRLRKAGLL